MTSEQESLLRLNALLAAGAHSEQVFVAVAAEAARLAGGAATALLVVDGSTCTVVARHEEPGAVGTLDHRAVGTRVDVGPGGDDLLVEVLRTGQPAHRRPRSSGQPPRMGIPVILGGRAWGVLEVVARDNPLTPAANHRLLRFVSLASGAVGSAAAQAELGELGEERAALRRMHQVAGNGGSGPEVLHAVVVEGAARLGVRSLLLARLEDDGIATVVAASGAAVPLGYRYDLAGNSVVARVLRHGTTERVDDDPEALGVPVTVNGQLWGAMVVIASPGPLPAGVGDRLARFLGAVLPTIAAAHARAELAEEQASLRRVAELVARSAAAPEVFDAVVREASALAHGAVMSLTRFEGPRQLLVMGAFGEPNAEVGDLVSFGSGTLPARILDGSRAVRVDDHRGEPDADLAETYGARASVAVPVTGLGSVWGMLTATSSDTPLPAGTEHRLERFADLVAAALANGQARAEIQALADEQASLRRVAELVARGTPPEGVFPALTREACGILVGFGGALMRYDPDGSAVIVAVHASPVPVGLRLPPYPGTPVGDVLRSGRAARLHSFEDTPLREMARELGVTEAVGVPINVEGRLWGLLSMSSSGKPLPVNAEVQLAQFAELAGAAIANAENRAKLQASRARVVATADETRRRLQRDVHDGAQQRLVHTIIALKLAHRAIVSGTSPANLVEEALTNAEQASRDLRDVIRGILPASLTEGGLRAGLESLVTGLVLPVELQVRAPRAPADTELTAYFVIAEALTNVVKHAHASRAWVEVFASDDTLTVVVRDDGVGGADPTRGSGLLGLLDRVDAASGTFTLTSPAGVGTTVAIWLPLRSDR